MGQGLFFCVEDNSHCTACIHTAIFPYSPKHGGCTLPWPMPSPSYAWVLPAKVLAAARRSCARGTTARIWWWDMLWPCAVCKVSHLPLETFPVWALRRKVATAPQLPTSSLEEVTRSWVLLRLRAVHSPGCGISPVVSRAAGPWRGRTTSPCPVQPRGAWCRAACIPPTSSAALTLLHWLQKKTPEASIRLPEMSSSPSPPGPDA